MRHQARSIQGAVAALPRLVAAIITLLLAQPAHAVAYAYAHDLFSGLEFSGASQGVTTYFASDSAQYSGFGDDNDVTTRDPRLVQSGLDRKGGENAFAPDPLRRARADALTTPNVFLGLSGEDVSEALRDSTGKAMAFTLSSAIFTLTQLADGIPVTISLSAHPSVEVFTSKVGESAEASVLFLVAFFDLTTKKRLFSWVPNGDPLHDFTRESGGVVSGVRDPFNLQMKRACKDGCAESDDLQCNFRISYLMTAGQAVEARVFWGSSVEIVAIPEPTTMALVFGASLAWGLGTRRRPMSPRRRSQGEAKPGQPS